MILEENLNGCDAPCLMTKAPGSVEKKQLLELALSIVPPENEDVSLDEEGSK